MTSSVLTSGPTFEWGSMWFYGVATTRIAFQKSPLPTVCSLSTSVNILLSWFIHNNPGGLRVMSNNQVVCQRLSFQPHPVPESSLKFQDQELDESCYPLCLAKPRTHIYIIYWVPAFPLFLLRWSNPYTASVSLLNQESWPKVHFYWGREP